jgi:hypothetical protein
MLSGKEKGMGDKSIQPIRRVLFYIFRTWVTRKDGRWDYAKDHGRRAWRIPVYEK